MKLDVVTKVTTALWFGLLFGAVMQYHFGEQKEAIRLVPFEKVEPNFYLPESTEALPTPVVPDEPLPAPKMKMVPKTPAPEPDPGPPPSPSRIEYAHWFVT